MLAFPNGKTNWGCFAIKVPLTHDWNFAGAVNVSNQKTGPAPGTPTPRCSCVHIPGKRGQKDTLLGRSALSSWRNDTFMEMR